MIPVPLVTCDRCGATAETVIDCGQEVAPDGWAISERSRLDLDFDLCPECDAQLDAWFEHYNKRHPL